tara:strand:- start:45 stop:611 length:567 start_codon:yes stop_codon:yes gene_type:complete
MTIFGLNSPELFIILVIILAILGPKRWEKASSLFLKLLKYLLNSEGDQSVDFFKSTKKEEINQFVRNKVQKKNTEKVIQNESEVITEPKEDGLKQDEAISGSKGNASKQEEAITEPKEEDKPKQEEVSKEIEENSLKNKSVKKDKLLKSKREKKGKVSAISKSKKSLKKEAISFEELKNSDTNDDIST